MKTHTKLTDHERTLIDAMRAAMTRNSMASATFISKHTGQSVQGAGLVLGSAVRKGLVIRHVVGGTPGFQLTRRGWDLARPRNAS